ncbi:MAG: hypothetical protein ACK52U_01405 [Synechococcaceae cyanobacterium]
MPAAGADHGLRGPPWRRLLVLAGLVVLAAPMAFGGRRRRLRFDAVDPSTMAGVQRRRCSGVVAAG